MAYKHCTSRTNWPVKYRDLNDTKKLIVDGALEDEVEPYEIVSVSHSIFRPSWFSDKYHVSAIVTIKR